MNKLFTLLLLLAFFVDNKTYAQETEITDVEEVFDLGKRRETHFCITTYIGVSGLANQVNFIEGTNKVHIPLTMSGVDFTYSFGKNLISNTVAELGVGIYHFSEKSIIGNKGLKLIGRYKYSREINNISVFTRVSFQVVFADTEQIFMLPRISVGIGLKDVNIGLYGEYQKMQADNVILDLNYNTIYTGGLEVVFAL